MAVLPTIFVVSVIIVGNRFTAVEGMTLSRTSVLQDHSNSSAIDGYVFNGPPKKAAHPAINIIIDPWISSLSTNSYSGVTDRTTFAIANPPQLRQIDCDAFGPSTVSRWNQTPTRKDQSLEDSSTMPDEPHSADLDPTFRLQVCIENETLVTLTHSEIDNCSSILYYSQTIIIMNHIKIKTFGKDWCCSGAGDESANVTYLPSIISEVIATGNLITKIEANTFSRMTELTRLELDWNQIMTIESGAFHNNNKLYSISLTNNRISNLAVGVFTGLPRLAILSLSHNELTTIPANVFNSPILDTIDLSYNNITVIERWAFKREPDLREPFGPAVVLDISNTLVQKLENGALFGLSKYKECFVKVADTPITFIEGHVFDE